MKNKNIKIGMSLPKTIIIFIILYEVINYLLNIVVSYIPNNNQYINLIINLIIVGISLFLTTKIISIKYICKCKKNNFSNILITLMAIILGIQVLNITIGEYLNVRTSLNVFDLNISLIEDNLTNEEKSSVDIENALYEIKNERIDYVYKKLVFPIIYNVFSFIIELLIINMYTKNKICDEEYKVIT